MLKIDIPSSTSSPTWRTLETFIRDQVQTCLQRVLDEEVDDLLGRGRHERRAADAVGYRNGYGKPRRVALMNGTITVRRPRVRGLDARFESRILPLFQRRTPEVAKLLPALYLHGLSSGDFTLALRGLLGDGAPLSASSVQRLTEDWQRDYAQWRREDLTPLEPVYVWADGIYVKAGLESTKAALLVLIAALADGSKVVLAVESGHRESTESWAEILRDLTARGLRAPACVIGDGALGLWNAVGQVWPQAAEQRGWNHTLRNVVDAVPLKQQADVQAAVQRIAAAESVATAEEERQRFHRAYRLRFPKACDRLDRDWARMLTYYQFPKEHWRHLRTTNVVESPFAAVRLRTTAAKRFKKVERATAIIWRLLQVAEKRFRKLNAPEQCRDVFRGVRYVDGLEVPVVSSTEKAAA
ncbi:MAG: IS256 family transposase [Gemmatimonas sp.]|uniref:IS256 family transposase n=1 Tax=Gemmatimonas sp. TaxID=1962908 RepID=UPI00391F2062